MKFSRYENGRTKFLFPTKVNALSILFRVYSILLFYHVHFIESRTKTASKFQGIIIGPEVHEEQAWIFSQHVAVKRCYFNTVVA